MSIDMISTRLRILRCLFLLCSIFKAVFDKPECFKGIFLLLSMNINGNFLPRCNILCDNDTTIGFLGDLPDSASTMAHKPTNFTGLHNE